MNENKKYELSRSIRKIRNLREQAKGIELKLENLEKQLSGLQTALDRELDHFSNYGKSDLSKIPTTEISEKREQSSRKKNEELESEKRAQLTELLKDDFPEAVLQSAPLDMLLDFAKNLKKIE